MIGKRVPLIVSLLLFFTAARAQVGISASPMKLTFDAQRAGTQTFTVIISNTSARPLELGVDINDWKRNDSGNILCSPVNSLPSSCGSWLKIFPSTGFTLGPSEKKEVTIMMNVPDSNITVARNSMIFFTQLNPEQGSSKGMNINIAVRIGIQIFYNPPGNIVKDIEITNFTDSTQRVANAAKTLLLTLHNNGTIETDGKVNFELTNMTTGKKDSVAQSDFYTLPGASRIIRLPLPATLKHGEYSATALVDYGQEQELKVGELEFKY